MTLSFSLWIEQKLLMVQLFDIVVKVNARIFRTNWETPIQLSFINLTKEIQVKKVREHNETKTRELEEGEQRLAKESVKT